LYQPAKGNLFSKAAKRIVSIVPSITEALIEFGQMPVGRTSFCIEPREKVGGIQVVGGTKTPKIDRILALQPDLVIANQEENRKEDVEALRRAGVKVWVTYPVSVLDVAPFLRELAVLCPDSSRAVSAIAECEEAVHIVSSGRLRNARWVAVLIWKNPWMAIGGRTYSGDMIEKAGGLNVFRDRESRYPEVSEEEILAEKPDLLLLPSEPYKFEETDRKEWIAKFQRTGLRTKVSLFSGEDLSWFGPRMARGLRELSQVIHG